MSPTVLNDKDVNASPVQHQGVLGGTGKGEIKGDVKSMEYHRQVLQSKLDNASSQQYVSPSDNIMSPCTAKLSAYRNKQVGMKSKPKSLFTKASTKNLEGGQMFADKPASSKAEL